MNIVSGSSYVNTEDDGRLNSEGGASPDNGRGRPVNSVVVVNTVSGSSYVNTEDNGCLHNDVGECPDSGRGRRVNSAVCSEHCTWRVHACSPGRTEMITVRV